MSADNRFLTGFVTFIAVAALSAFLRTSFVFAFPFAQFLR